MTTKTASVRLEKELFDKIDEKCVTFYKTMYNLVARTSNTSITSNTNCNTISKRNS